MLCIGFAFRLTNKQNISWLMNNKIVSYSINNLKRYCGNIKYSYK